MKIIKKGILTASFIITTIASITAQNVNIIPSSPHIKQLPNGWHKFAFEGTNFDVEVEEGYLIKGNIVWFDGSKYSGQLSNFSISGRGTYSWVDGRRYEGSFKNNLRHGKGSLIEQDNSKWSGKWKNNKKNGKGTLFDKSGKIVKKGTWKENKYIDTKKK
ncbi:hypothetical protein [uncultured Algibacter sp.]|uniref:hypothetical protein n=1 Tax=uncultured Algibacter sp. TaxID=298659 RepID=UPI003217CE56